MKTQLGSQEDAQKIFTAYYVESPAYRKLIDSCGGVEISWDSIPVLTKKNFYQAHPWREILPRKNYLDIYQVLRSSGTTSPDGKSRGFFWPKLKSRDRAASPILQKMLAEIFALPRRKTLIIIGLSLGSWAGGEEFSFTFKALALQTDLPLVVFSPGNQHQEILEILDKAGAEFDQILIALCPSAIFYLERLAEQEGKKLPMEKICFLVTGEPFPEELRLQIQERPGRRPDILPMLSVYGSADTGILGFESQPLIRARQAIGRNLSLAQSLGFTSTSIPNLYHAHLSDGLLESVGEELLVTRWQGIPLVRYNLKDRVRFFSWKDLCKSLEAVAGPEAPIWQQAANLPLPDVLSVSGRSEGCVFLCGSNLFESMLQEAFLRSGFAKICSSNFVAWVSVEKGRQVLNLQFEQQAKGPSPDEASLKSLYKEFVDLLGKQQPEFADDYEKFYRPFEKEGFRVLSFHFSEPGYLSNHPRFQNAVKRKIFLDEGPI